MVFSVSPLNILRKPLVCFSRLTNHATYSFIG
jgi:hypothetical protein